MDSRLFDKRGYPIVGAAEGYGEWAATYEATVAEGLDLPLLQRIRSIDWPAVGSVADLACGTGRTGQWLKNKGVARLDGVDITPEMLALAERRGAHDSLHLGDVGATPLVSSAYDLCTLVLADEHLANVGPVYREAWRLLRADGKFLIIGYHPFFLMNGMPTHFHRDGGEAITIESHVHLFQDHFKAGCAAELSLIEAEECIVDEEWLKTKPKWRKYLNWPVSFAHVWQKGRRQEP
jgi:SAM-dependent methyltransferase